MEKDIHNLNSTKETFKLLEYVQNLEDFREWHKIYAERHNRLLFTDDKYFTKLDRVDQLIIELEIVKSVSCKFLNRLQYDLINWISSETLPFFRNRIYY